MSFAENPYAIFDPESIKEGDFHSNPPTFTLYENENKSPKEEDENDDSHSRQNHCEVKQQQPLPHTSPQSLAKPNLQQRNFSTPHSRFFVGSPRMQKQFAHNSFRRSEGHGNNIMHRKNSYKTQRSNLFGRSNQDSTSTYHDDVFMPSTSIEVDRSMGGFSWPTRSLSLNSYAMPLSTHPDGIGSMNFVHQLPSVYWHREPLHFHQQRNSTNYWVHNDRRRRRFEDCEYNQGYKPASSSRLPQGSQTVNDITAGVHVLSIGRSADSNQKSSPQTSEPKMTEDRANEERPKGHG